MKRTRSVSPFRSPFHSRRAITASSLALSLLVACGPGDHARAIDEPSSLSRIDTGPRRPVDHGELTFDTWIPATITRSEPVHTWTFTLTAAAQIELRTEASSEGDVDTVLSLYREGQRGWGRAIARNDDAADGVLSALSRALTAGRYRVVVAGHHARTAGTFILASECSGGGCPAEPAQCLFGASFYDLLHAEERTVEIIDDEHITSVDQLTDDLSLAQLVLAVQQSSHADVTSAAQALSRVDQQTVRRMSLRETASGNQYTALEYGAGDNSYGAIFVQGTRELAASIHDGDFLNCTAYAPECLLPDFFFDLRQSPDFEPGTMAVLTSHSLAQLSAVERAQLLAALRVNYTEEDAPTLESAIAHADGGRVNQLHFRDRVRGRELVIYEHGAGDTSVGAVFEGAGETIRAVISDGAFEDCHIFR